MRRKAIAMKIADALLIDPAVETERIAQHIRNYLRDVKRKGAVIGLSGGIDSSVTAALCARAVGSEHVFGIFMPDADSSPESLLLGQLLAAELNIRTTVEDITATLHAAGCYRRRDAAIQCLIPDYGEGYRSKIVVSSGPYQLFSIVVRSPEGVETKVRLPLETYLMIVAATNFKQRTRKMLEYFHADRLHYAVAGTPNRLEYDQGFFVKNGDGAADFKPIAHLYKSQVYLLAEYLGIPEDIRRRPPTTDTYSLEQSQDEFFFSLPYELMDMAIYARDHDLTAAEAAAQLGISEKQMKRVYGMIDSKRKSARYLHLAPALMA